MENNKYISNETINNLTKGQSLNIKQGVLKKFVDNGYIVQGFNDEDGIYTKSLQKQNDTFTNRVKGNIQNRRNQLTDAIGEIRAGIKGTTQEQDANSRPAGDYADASYIDTPKNSALTRVRDVLQGTLRAGGAFAGAVGDSAGLLFTELDRLAGSPTGKLLNGILEKVGFNKLDEDTQKNILASIDVGTAGVGAKALAKPLNNLDSNIGKAVGEVGDVAKNVGKKVKGSIIPNEAQAIKSVRGNLENQLTGTKRNKNTLDTSRTDLLDTISKNTDYHPKIDAENKQFDTSESLGNINRDIEIQSTKLDDLLGSLDKLDNGINTKNIIESIKKNIIKDKDFKSVKATGGEKVFSEINDLVNNIQDVYGDKIPRTEAVKIRRRLDDAIETISDTNLKKQLRQNVRKTFKENIEDSAGSYKDIIKEANNETGKLLEARDFLKDINGQKIKGGRLGDMFRNALASNTGAFVGAGLGFLGGPVGAVVGYFGSKLLGKTLAKNTIAGPITRSVLSKIKNKLPEVFDNVDNLKGNVDEILKKVKDKARKDEVINKFLKGEKVDTKQVKANYEKIVDDIINK